MKIKELIKALEQYDLEQNVVIYSNENTLTDYQFLGTYENAGQVEIHINDGINLG